MNPKLKNALVYTVKNAVNAGLLAAVEIFHDKADNNLTSWHGIKGVLWILVSAMLAREAMVWVPALIKWSQTNGAPPLAPPGGTIQ